MKKLESTDAYLSALDNHVVTVIDFAATWCGPCQALSPKIDKIADEYEMKEETRSGKKLVGFFKVDVDELESVSSSLGIRDVPVVIFFLNGQECKRAIGLDEIVKKVNPIIESCLRGEMKPAKKTSKKPAKKKTKKRKFD